MLPHISKELVIAALVIAGEMIIYHIFVIIKFDIQEPAATIVEFTVKYSIAAIMAFFTIFFILGVSVIRNRDLFNKIFEIQTKKGEAKRAVQSLFKIRVEEFLFILKKLEDENDEGAEVDYDLASKFARFCFQEGTAYSGTDSHTPSKYWEVQHSYLDVHKMAQDPGKIDEESKNEDSPKNTRLLIIDEEEQDFDEQGSNYEFSQFVQWHKDHKVKLKRVNPDDAKKNKEIYKLKSTEIALWYDKYSLQWRGSDKNPEKVVLSLAYNGSTQYKACSDYIEALNRLAVKIIPKGTVKPPKKLKQELAKSWVEFVDPRKREKNVNDFLLPIVQKYRNEMGKRNDDIRILDAAAGLGCETDFFDIRGYNVTANEIDEKVYGSMPNHGKKVVHTKHDWRVVASKFPVDEFDIILLLGNSFCLLDEDSDRRRVLQQFHKILRHNGLLIIDQRNFDKILNYRSEVVSLNKFYNNYYKSICLYCGEGIKGWPIRFDDNTVIFSYGQGEQKTLQEIPMHMFQKHELKSYIKSSNFSDIKVYSDMDLSKDDFFMDADFFTFVAKK